MVEVQAFGRAAAARRGLRALPLRAQASWTTRLLKAYPCFLEITEQLADAAGVVAVQGSGLDPHYPRHWARELNVEDKLRDLLSGRIRPKQT